MKYFLLSLAYLYFTFFTNKFSICNAEIEKGMQSSHPVLTSETTVWNAWIGFNASHSSGGMFMAAIIIYLAGFEWQFFAASLFIQLLTIGTTLFLLLVGKKYWFDKPNNGIRVAFMCYVLAFTLMHLPVNAFK